MKQHHCTCRSGYAAIIAMLLLALGTVLALGFTAMVRSAQDIAGNTQRVVQARRAADSGVEFITHTMIKVATPSAGMSGRVSSNWITPLAQAMAAELDTTTNLGVGRVETDGIRITIPAISLEDSSWFTAEITPSDIASDDGLALRVTGRCGSGAVTRRVAVNLNSEPERVMSALRFAIASKKGIELPSNTHAGVYGYDPDTNATDGRVGSTAPIGDATVVVLHKPTEPVPDFSDIVRLIFPDLSSSFLDADYRSVLAALPRGGSSLTGTYANCYIPANTNPTFNNATLNGIIYVEWPNNINLTGTSAINGVIVYQPKVGTQTSTIDLHKDAQITNDRARSVAQLEQIGWLSDAQRKMLSSWAIIAPNTNLQFSNGAGVRKYFENSVNVNNVTGIGQGNTGTSLIMNQASIIADGYVDFGGNRVLWMVPAEDDGSDGGDYLVRRLYVMQTTYREPL